MQKKCVYRPIYWHWNFWVFSSITNSKNWESARLCFTLRHQHVRLKVWSNTWSLPSVELWHRYTERNNIHKYSMDWNWHTLSQVSESIQAVDLCKPSGTFVPLKALDVSLAVWSEAMLWFSSYAKQQKWIAGTECIHKFSAEGEKNDCHMFPSKLLNENDLMFSDNLTKICQCEIRSICSLSPGLSALMSMSS